MTRPREVTRMRSPRRTLARYSGSFCRSSVTLTSFMSASSVQIKCTDAKAVHQVSRRRSGAGCAPPVLPANAKRRAERPKGGKMIDALRAPYGALLLRVSMGVLFILHGLYLKAMVFGMAGAGKYFASLGLPDWFAWVVMIYETLGGLALIFGVYTRWVAVFLGVHLLFAAYLGHVGNGWMFTAKGGGYEYPLFWAIVCFP